MLLPFGISDGEFQEVAVAKNLSLGGTSVKYAGGLRESHERTVFRGTPRPIRGNVIVC